MAVADKTTSNSNTKTASSKHGSKFNSHWKTSYSWLEYHAQQNVMYCRLCKEVKQSNVSAWTNGNSNFREDKIKQHNTSPFHHNAEKVFRSRKRTPTTHALFEPQIVVERSQLLLALRTMYSLLQRRVAFDQFSKEMDFLTYLEVATPVSELPGNANLRSERIKSELIHVLGNVVRQKIISQVKQSPTYSLIIDETCDVSIKEQCIVYIKYLDADFRPVTSFVGLVELKAGDAATIHDALVSFAFEILALERERFTGFGSDGAQVMTGRHHGVAARLRECESSAYLLNIHCVAHRLALALGSSGNSVIKVKYVLDRLDALHRHYEKSFVRTSGLRDIQKALELEPCTLSQAVSTRWLSYERCIRNVKKAYPAIIISLERESSERKEAKAYGFMKAITEWDFVLTVELLDLVLPRLALLSKSLQATNIDYGSIQTLVNSTHNYLKDLKSSAITFTTLTEKLDDFIARRGLIVGEEDQRCITRKPTDQEMDHYKANVSIHTYM